MEEGAAGEVEQREACLGRLGFPPAWARGPALTALPKVLVGLNEQMDKPMP